MHDAVRHWIALHRAKIAGPEVLDIGSLDINGSARKLLGPEFNVLGIDWRPGRGVDEVALAHEWDPRGRCFHAVTILEVLEHDPHWARTLAAGVRVLRPGGVLLATWAGPARKPHEVGVSPQQGYYKNLGPLEVLRALAATGSIRSCHYEQSPDEEDVYLCAVARGGSVRIVPHADLAPSSQA